MRIMGFETIAANSVYYYINKPGCIIVDLRSSQEYTKGHIPSAVNIPYEELSRYSSMLARYQEVVLYCSRGNMSLLMAKNLKLPGVKVINLYGGIHVYRGELEKGDNNI